MTKPIEKLNLIERLRLLSAFQVLSLPTGAMGVTHKRAKTVILEMTGKTPPKKAQPPVGGTLESYIEWINTP